VPSCARRDGASSCPSNPPGAPGNTGADAYTPKDAARAGPWAGPDDPGGWSPVQRRFRDGHIETWWATDAQLGWWGPDGHTRLVIATTDPQTLPDKATWYLATNLARPGGPHDTPGSAHEPADLTEVVRLYGIWHWIEQSYKQVKDELGWADFQVRSDVAIRRHQVLVNCAFSFCWDAWFAHPAPAATPPAPDADGGERGARARRAEPAPAILAPGAARRARLARPVDRAAALVDRMVERAPAPPAARPDDIPASRPRPAPLHP
jgi:hypothetical protein